MSSSSSSSYFTPLVVFSSAILLRTILLFYGLIQDEYSPVKYTDIDYFVFTDAARYLSRGGSPYQRETYRYTPLLAWLLLPATFPGVAWFSFGKVVFALADIVAGWLVVLVLKSPAGGGMTRERALKFAAIWLLNPMVATISTRGSSEGLLCVMVVALLWAVIHERIGLAGVLLGLAVHFKIYPFIYGVSILWYLDPLPKSISSPQKTSELSRPAGFPFARRIRDFITPSRISLVLSSLATFMSLNLLMYSLYSTPFLTHTFLHHLTRIDHRHNFSPYNTLLYLSSSSPPGARTSNFHFESLAFIPQLALSAFLIPLTLAKKDLAGTMLAQTFAFVTFNKVCTSQVFLVFYIAFPSSYLFFWTSSRFLLLFAISGKKSSIHSPLAFPLYPPRCPPPTFLSSSTLFPPPLPFLNNQLTHSPPFPPAQYFLWYTILLPFYLPYSSLLSSPRLGLLAGTLWILSQVSPPPTLLFSLPSFFPNPRTSNPPKNINTGNLAPPSLPARIPRPQHLRAWTVGRRMFFLCRQRVDLGRRGGGCWEGWGKGWEQSGAEEREGKARKGERRGGEEKTGIEKK